MRGPTGLPLQGAKILVVDDNVDLAENLVEILEDEGALVEHAPTAAQALALVRPETDVALIDIGLPDATGLDLVPAIREIGDGHIGVVLITGVINLFVGSASAKWALLAPILVPMLMQLGISPDLTQAAYRIGDSSTNIITPLMPYFPLVVVFCQRYVTATGIGTVVAMMLPYTIGLLLVWTGFLLLYWTLGIPLGL